MQAPPKRKIYKRCAVHSCRNTTTTTPNKLFLTVPVDPKVRQKWCIAVRRSMLSGSMYCCEDHFDLQEDTENWMRYKLTRNVKLRLKKTAVPHIFSGTDNVGVKRVAASKLAQKRLVEEALAAAEERERQAAEKEEAQRFAAELMARKAKRNTPFETVFINVDQIHTDKFVTDESKEMPKPLGVDKSIQVRPHFRSKATLCYLKMPDPEDCKKNPVIVKKKKRGRKRKKVPLPEMVVFESSDDDEFRHRKPAILRRARLGRTSEEVATSTSYSKRDEMVPHDLLEINMCSGDESANPVPFVLAAPLELVEVTLGHDDDGDAQNHYQKDISKSSCCDKGVQAFIRPPYRSKAITCNLPIVPLKRIPSKVNPSLVAEDIVHQQEVEEPEDANKLYFTALHASATHSTDDRLPTSNKQYIVIKANTLNHMLNETFMLLNVPPAHLPEAEDFANQECQTPYIKTDTKSAELKKFKPDNGLVQVKDHIKEEIVNEDYKESSLLPLARIKQEVEDPGYEYLSRNFIDCCVKQEPHFEECADAYS